MYGIYPESHTPTGRPILEHSEDLAIVFLKHRRRQTLRLAELAKPQRLLIDLINLSPASLRTFKASACKQPRIGQNKLSV